MTNAVGPDVARYQIYFDPSKATGAVDFAFEKATEGTVVHSAFETMWLGVKQCAVRGAYHYQRNGNWQAQADAFLQATNPKSFHILALDVEGYSNIVDNTFLLDSQRIINYLISKTTRKIILYTNGSIYAKLKALTGAWLNNIPLWIADPDNAAGSPDITPWAFHQHSWTGSGARWGTGGATDENVYNGTLAQLKQWAGVTDTPPNGEPMTYGKAQEIKGNVPSVRLAPDVSGQKVGSLTAGVIVDFMELVPGSLKPADRWLKLPNGIHYVNQNVGGVELFRILFMPTTEPSPARTVTDINIALAAGSVVTRVYSDGTTESEVA